MVVAVVDCVGGEPMRSAQQPGRLSLLLDLFTFLVTEVLALWMRRTNGYVISSSTATSATLVPGFESFHAAVCFHSGPQFRFRLDI